MTRKEAENIRNALVGTTDALASTVPKIFPVLTYSGKLIPYKTRIKWTDGYLYVAQYDTYDREDTDPAHDANGWAKLEYRDGYRFIPVAMTTATMFKAGERGWWNGRLYESLIDNNSWTPVGYPAGWKII